MFLVIVHRACVLLCWLREFSKKKQNRLNDKFNLLFDLRLYGLGLVTQTPSYLISKFKVESRFLLFIRYPYYFITVII